MFDRLVGSDSRAAPAHGARQKAGSRNRLPPLFDLVLDDLQSENDAALAVRQGRVDVVLGAQSAAQSFGLGFVPVLRERVDLLVNRRSYFEPPMQVLLGFCRTQAFADYARDLGGYDLSGHGEVIWNAA